MADRALTFVELDVPYCALEYGTTNGSGTCPAVLGVDSAAKCFNSLGTCPSTVRSSFTDAPTTMRFAKPAAYLPEAGIEAIASIESVSYSPAIISLGESLGQRASLTVTFQDHRHSDTGAGFDKYLDTRTYDPFGQGTFWGKFRSRHPFLRGRPLRLIQGLLGDDLADMDTRHFLIESFEGPTLDGKFTITAKDALKLADGDRAQAPVLSKGSLNADITAGTTSAQLSPAGIGNTDYPASGHLNIGGKEIVAFTRSGDTLTITRGQEGTTAVAHEAGDRCQICLDYSADDPADIIHDLLTTYAGVPASYITLADWQAETAAYYRRVNTAMIAEPTSVRQLLTELIEQVGLVIWWDDLAQKIRLQVLRSIATDAETFDDSNIVADTLRVKEQPERRISQVWTFFGLKSPLEPLSEPSSYRSSVLKADLDAEENDGSKVKKIFSRWIPFGGSSAAARVNEIQLGRFVTAPREISFDLFRRGAETPALGEGVRIESLAMQDPTGAYENVPAQIVRLRPDDTVWTVTAEEMRFVDLSEEDLATKTLTIDSNSFGINLRTLYDANFTAPAAGDVVVCNINAGVIVGSTSTASPAFDVGSWLSVAATGNRTNGSPVLSGLSINTTTEGLTAGMFVRGAGIPNGTKILSVDSTSQVTLDANCTSSGTGGALTFYTVLITVNLRGRVQGKGGNGGNPGPGNGGDGGDALYVRYPVNLIIDTGDAEVWGGGGGGGGSAVGTWYWGDPGGGGAGSLPGTKGAEPSTPTYTTPATNGTTEAGGDGAFSYSTAYGGDGGDPGQAGSPGVSAGADGSGGAAGKAIDGLSYIKKTGAGDIRGAEVN